MSKYIIAVRDEEHSKEIQKELVDQGYRWCSGETYVNIFDFDTDLFWLCFNSETKKITRGHQPRSIYKNKTDINLEGLKALNKTFDDGFLPEKFELNPAGNESLSRAMQERLFKLNIYWAFTKNISHCNENWLQVCSGNPSKGVIITYSPKRFNVAVKENWPVLTLDDLYRLKPRPAESFCEIESVCGSKYKFRVNEHTRSGKIQVIMSTTNYIEYLENLLEFCHSRFDYQKIFAYTYAPENTKIGCKEFAPKQFEKLYNWLTQEKTKL